ncbi:MAG: OmpA family protein, partial [Flavobacteriales bacterium]|nr:OmpA family protein [Flavobacteriales bacterium]
AGEKILIKSLASGNTTTETLNDKEQFKFEAEAGDKIEIRMMNPMLETKDPVFTYDVPQPIIDPYQDMGERTIVPEKIDMLTAYLNSKAEKQTLIAKYRLTNVPEEAQPLSGTVIDKITLEPLVNTEVVATAADGQQYTGYTDDKGVFTLLVPVKAGIMNITAKGENFVPKTIQVDTEVTQHDVTHVEMQLVYTDAYINKLKKEGWEDVSGVVNDATSKKGVDGARVSATTPDGKVYVTETDETGKFMLMVPGRNIEKIDINHKNYNTSLVALPAANNGTLPDNLKVTLDRTVVYAEQIHQDYLDKNGVNINGVLIDAEDGMPLMDATVTATDKDGHFYAATTDDNGNWTMRVPQGAEMKITAEKKDYSMVTIQAITPKGKGKMNGDTKIAMKHTAEYKAMIEAQASEMGYDKVELSGLVVDMTTGNAMPNANITLKFTNGEEMTYMTDADGRFTIVVTKDEHMTFTVSKDDYLSQTIEMNTKASSSSLMNDMKVKLPHTPEYLAEHGGMIDPEEGKKSPGFENLVDLEALDIQNVLFDYDKAFIREDSKPILDQVARIMKEQPSFNLVVRTHCDARGSIAYNQQLSMSRAMAVKGYLMQKGINKNRVKTEWFGEAKPLNHCVDENSNCSEQEFELNRRAEFKLVSDSFSQTVDH